MPSGHVAQSFSREGEAVGRIVSSSKAPTVVGAFCFLSGRWESNPVNVLPKHAYYRYTTARIRSAFAL